MTEKTRTGSKVTKKYDQAKTPYQRVLEAPLVPLEKKDALRSLYDTLNPAALKRSIKALQDRLLEINAKKERPGVRSRRQRQRPTAPPTE